LTMMARRRRRQYSQERQRLRPEQQPKAPKRQSGSWSLTTAASVDPPLLRLSRPQPIPTGWFSQMLRGSVNPLRSMTVCVSTVNVRQLQRQLLANPAAGSTKRATGQPARHLQMPQEHRDRGLSTLTRALGARTWSEALKIVGVHVYEPATRLQRVWRGADTAMRY
jgi:hypothetical protein